MTPPPRAGSRTTSGGSPVPGAAPAFRADVGAPQPAEHHKMEGTRPPAVGFPKPDEPGPWGAAGLGEPLALRLRAPPPAPCTPRAACLLAPSPGGKVALRAGTSFSTGRSQHPAGRRASLLPRHPAPGSQDGGRRPHSPDPSGFTCRLTFGVGFISLFYPRPLPPPRANETRTVSAFSAISCLLLDFTTMKTTCFQEQVIKV